MSTVQEQVRRVVSYEIERGLSPIRAAIALALSKFSMPGAVGYAQERWPQDPVVPALVKAAVSPTTGADVPTRGNAVAAFLGIVHSREIFAQLTRLRRVPASRGVALQTVGSSAGWVGEGKATPIVTATMTEAALMPLKIAAITVVTSELAQLNDPGAEALIRDDLAAAIADEASLKFLSADAASANVSPAGIAHGISATAGGSDVVKDFMTAVAGFKRADNVAVCMPPHAAVALALAAPGAVSGGAVGGVKVIPTDAANSRMVAFDQTRIAFTDAGVAVDASEHGAVQLDSAPSDSAASLVSLWQSGYVGLRGTRYLNWSGDGGGVQVISGIAGYGT